MKPRLGTTMLILAMDLVGLSLFAGGQPGRAANRLPAGDCGGPALSAPVTVHAPKGNVPTLSFCDGRALAGGAQLGDVQPLALASSDFDGDGVPDLASGYKTGKGGAITVHRSNIAALWPYGAALRNGPPAAFLTGPRSFALPEEPDFLVAGDFDGDGRQDLVAAHRGSDGFYFLRGDGHGGFAAAKRIAAGGSITALISGEIDRRDGLPDLILGVTTAGGPRVIVLEGPNGAVKAQAEIFPMPQPATALALGRFHGSVMIDLAVGAGDNLVLIEGRDRKLSLGPVQQVAVAPARVAAQRVGYTIQALESGDFTGGSPSIAALGDDGHVHILEHAVTDSSLLGKMLSDPDFVPSIQVPGRAGKEPEPAQVGKSTPSIEQRLSAVRSMAKSVDEGPEWVERSAIALPSGFAQSAPNLRAARVSGSLQDDLIVTDTGTGRVHILSMPRANVGTKKGASGTSQPGMRLLASLEADNAPAAVLPMRLNQFGLQGLVVLQDGVGAPVVMPQTIPAANIFTVTNTSDELIANGPTPTGPPGSLRKAMVDAEGASVNASGGGEYEIVFNIPTSDPGYDAATGTFLIQPLSEAAPGAFNEFALPPINETVIIDGYTQPGASPNTLATGDNAKILIRIDGAKATTPGGSGFVPFDDTNSTFRGFDFTGWVNGMITNGDESGAWGIEANGVGDYIEGNFFGTDPTGTLAIDPKTNASYANRIGVFADNGPAFGNMSGGTIIGGTTPQARNILSNNLTGGILFLSTALEGRLDGNFIGVDASGAKALSNVYDGTGANGPTIIIGGTLPGDGNVISANGTNIDFNDITSGGQANGSMAQGNLVGTDATGKLNVSRGVGSGASISTGPTDETIGGTTPAARNILSGNYYGVYIVNSTTGNVIQGNYIGTDVTGTKAIGNVQQGLYQGATDSSSVPAISTAIGGEVASAGNLISGNVLDGISISGTTLGGPDGDQALGSTIQGNLIGTDVTGKLAIPNGATGITLLAGASRNVIGGSDPGAGNIIAHNTSHGVLIDSASNGNGNGNNAIGNAITNNGGAGVRIVSGADNRISQNSIYQNAALGIDLGASGVDANTGCNTASTGANNLQNYPVLTAGTGTQYFTATATDPNGNTSEFSQAVASSSGNMLDLLGSFNSTANTTFTIEFFSSPTADPSGYGQGLTYLGSTQLTTGSDCTVPINTPLNPDDADVSITLSSASYQLATGPDFGEQVYTAAVQNLGPATATNVVVTDVLPSSETISSLYCNLGPCQSAVTTSYGACTVKGQTVTCNLGTLAAGQTATVNIPVQVVSTGTITDTATVAATQADPNTANNSSSVTKTATNPEPFIDFPGGGQIPNIVPSSAIAGSADLPITIYGIGFLPSSTVTFNSAALPTVSFVDNQTCGYFDPYYCAGINLVIPASLLTNASTATISVSNPDPGPGGSNEPSTANFTIAPSCTFSVSPDPDFSDGLENDGTTLIAEQVSVESSAASCTYAASSSVNWVVPLETAPVTVPDATSQYTSLDFAVAPNTASASRSGSITVAGQVINFTQAGGATCSYTLSSPSANFTPAGAAGSVNVTAVGGDSCAPFVVSYASWITVPESSGLLLNSGPASFTVSPNTGAARTGNIMIGGYVFTVNQAAPPCSYSLGPGSSLWGAAGGSGEFAVTASGPSCAWSATSSDTSVVSVTSGASGTGDGTVKYSIAANKSGPQTPTITVADKTGGSSAFTISQASAYSCTFTLTPSTVHVAADGTSNFFQVTPSQSICSWTASSNNPTTLTANPNAGDGVVYYSLAQNPSTQPRTLTITAGCETFTVIQDGTGVTNPVPAITSLSPTGATAGSGTLTLTVNGSGFLSSSVVNFNGNPLTTQFVSATQLTASIPAGDLTTVGKPPITVVNPAPGGGTSNAINFNITAAAAPGATLTSTLAFPSTTVSKTSAAMAATLKNSGNATLTINSITLGGANPSDFAITTGANACGTTLAASASCSIYVTFTPASATSFTAKLSVADNVSGSPQSATLTGTGTAAAVPGASLTPTSLAFGNQTVNTGSAAQTVTLKNTGTATLTGIAITLSEAPGSSVRPQRLRANASGIASTDYSATTTCGATLTAGSSCTISVTFTPTTTGSLPGTLIVTDNASGSPQTASLTGAGTTAAVPGATLSPTTLPFGNQTENTSSAAQTLTLKNTGTATLTGIAITLSETTPQSMIHRARANVAGITSADYSATTTCGATLTAGSSCTISVTFTPTTTGSLPGTLSVSDHASGSPQTAALTGTGTATPVPVVSLSQTLLAFGNQTQNTSSAPQTVTMKNTGTATLTGIAISLSEGTPPSAVRRVRANAAGITSTDYSATTTCGTPLTAGSSCTISVTFTPTTTGSLPGTLSVSDNASGSPQSVSLTGTGTATPVPGATLAPTSLAFGNQTENTTSAAQTVTLTNSGTATLTGIAIILSEPTQQEQSRRIRANATGISSTDYSATTTCGTTLTAGASCTIAVTFTPTSIGSLPGRLSVTDDASNSPQTASLTGTGTATPVPSATLTPTSLTFGNQTQGTSSAAQQITLENSGTGSLNISGATITESNGSDIVRQVRANASGISSADYSATTTCGSTLAAGASCTYSITFAPTTTGSLPATLTVTDDASNSPQTASLTGTGVARAPGDFTVSATPAQQTVSAGSTAQYNVTVGATGGSFSSAVALTVTGLPTGSTATFTPSSITPGSTNGTSVLSIQTAAAATASNSRQMPIWPLGTPALALLIFAVPRRLRRPWQKRFLLAVLAVATLGGVAALTGCGGGFALTQQPETYTLTVTGTSGSDVHSTTVQLTVQ